MNFIPDEGPIFEVPYFEDVTSSGGWAGHTTSKSENDLMSEIGIAIGRLGGIVYRWIPGAFGSRPGYRMLFTLQGGKPGRIDVVALPLRTKKNSSGYDAKKKAAIKMALFNLRDQLESLWRMQQLIPGYFGLLPLMLANGEQTIGELWVTALDTQMVLPASVAQDETIDGEFFEEVTNA